MPRISKILKVLCPLTLHGLSLNLPLHSPKSISKYHLGALKIYKHLGSCLKVLISLLRVGLGIGIFKGLRGILMCSQGSVCAQERLPEGGPLWHTDYF